MFKKYYFVHLKEKNVKLGSDYQEFTGIVLAKNPIEARWIAEENAVKIDNGYYVVEIHRI